MVEGVMTDIMYRVPSDKTAKKVIVTEESVTENVNPVILHEGELSLPKKSPKQKALKAPKEDSTPSLAEKN